MLVEPPRAMSIAIAFMNAFSVMMLLGVSPSSRRVIICRPVSKAMRILVAPTGGAVAIYGRVIPMASMRHCIEFAVNIPAQAPALPQQMSSK